MPMTWATCPVTGRFVIDIADKSEVPGPLSVCIEHIVRTHVTDLLWEVAQHDARFRGKLIPSGSFYEGTKVTTPNEFDYMYELRGFPPDSIVAKHVFPPIYRPTQEETPHRGYFTLEVHPTTTESHQVIDADVIFQVFFESLKTAAGRQTPESIEQTMLSTTNMKRNGPAVTLSFTTREPVNTASQECPNPWLSKCFQPIVRKPGYAKHFQIKVDIVLAVPMLITNLKLNEGHIETNFGEEDNPEMLHLVPSGNCWKLSVAQQESRLIRNLLGVDWRPQETVIEGGEHSNSNLQSYNLDANTIYREEEILDDNTGPRLNEMESEGGENRRVHNQLSDERVVEMEAYGERKVRVQSRHAKEFAVAQKCRRSCLVALKHLRDMHETSGVMKKAILPTYPLKVAFMQECLDHPENEDWTEDKLGGRVYNILDKVDTQSRDGSLTSCFLPNVPVLKSANHNISKQVSSIKGTLHKDFKGYRFVSGMLIVGCVLGIFAALSILYSAISEGISLCCSNNEKTGSGSFCCSNNEKTGNICVFFNGTYPCPSVHSSNRSTLQIIILAFAVGSFISQNIWNLAVTLFRMVTWLCRCQRKHSFYCIPLGLQSIPFLAFAVYFFTAVYMLDEKYLDVQLVNIASLELVYLFYEVVSLIYICLLRQRNQSISECFGPFRKLTRFHIKRPVEPYFEHVSKYTKCSRNSF